MADDVDDGKEMTTKAGGHVDDDNHVDESGSQSATQKCKENPPPSHGVDLEDQERGEGGQGGGEYHFSRHGE